MSIESRLQLNLHCWLIPGTSSMNIGHLWYAMHSSPSRGLDIDLNQFIPKFVGSFLSNNTSLLPKGFENDALSNRSDGFRDLKYLGWRPSKSISNPWSCPRSLLQGHSNPSLFSSPSFFACPWSEEKIRATAVAFEG